MKKIYITLALLVAVLALAINVNAATTSSTTYYGPNGGSAVVTTTTGSNSYGTASYYNIQTSKGGNYNAVVGKGVYGGKAVYAYGTSPSGVSLSGSAYNGIYGSVGAAGKVVSPGGVYAAGAIKTVSGIYAGGKIKYIYA